MGSASSRTAPESQPNSTIKEISSPVAISTMPKSNPTATQRAGKSTADYRPEIVQTHYTSDEVSIPTDFLKVPAEDCEAITLTHVDFESAGLPEYKGAYAVILENVLSSTECATLLGLAERSAKMQGWRPAMLNVGRGREMLATDTRNSDRIIWDSTEIADRIWERCCIGAPELRRDLARIENNAQLQGRLAMERGEAWKFLRPNDRLRFLKYSPGQYFLRHCDGAYSPTADVRTFYTLHLYLGSGVGVGASGVENTDAVGSVDDSGLVGGATSFHPGKMLFSDEKEGEVRLDVDSKPGRVLIFQHKNLVHSGATVLQGVKFTMRTDLMYQRELIDDGKEICEVR